MPETGDCAFCRIVAREHSAAIVLEDDTSMAFLDQRPVFPGHCLLVPKTHFEPLPDLPADLLQPLFRNAQLLAEAMVRGLEADGSFVAVNNHVSQSVPHLHIHVVPRRRKDGLRGFFWPRTRYTDDAQMHAICRQLREAIAGTQR